MDNLTLEQKEQQFHEFFTIKHVIKVNLKPLAENFSLPDADDMLEHMPYAFRIAGEISNIESQALRPLRHLGEHASELADFLNHQSRKIDLIMSYILQQQDDHIYRYETFEFGGGGVTIVSEDSMALGQHYELKLFLAEEASAVFCFAEVIACHERDDKYHISLIFTRIREEDQELLVRASLHQQTLQLRQRANKNKHDNN